MFATGTAVSNSMTEVYNMQRYLQPQTLGARRAERLRRMASMFARKTTSLELKPEGSGFQVKTRFSSFTNLPELITMFASVCDVKTAADIALPGIPEARRENVALEPSPEQVRMVAELGRRADAIRSGSVDPASDQHARRDQRRSKARPRPEARDPPTCRTGTGRRPPRPRRRSGAYGGTANRRAASRSCSAT